MTGRPSDIDKVIQIAGPDGQRQVTVADRIVEMLEAGNFFEVSCGIAGVHRETAYGWIRTAKQARIKQDGQLTLSDHEARCISFSDAVQGAEDRYHAGAQIDLQRLARGGVEQTVTTRKTDHEGNVESTVRTSHTLPDADVIFKRLRARFPEQYAERLAVDLGGQVELSVPERAASVLEVVRAHRKRKMKKKEPPTDGSEHAS